MDYYWKAAALSMVTVLLGLVLEKKAKDFSVILSLAGCILIGGIALHYLDKILKLFRELEDMGNISSDVLFVIIKALAIGFVTEIACAVCNDSGNSALGKTLQLTGNAAIIYLSIPVFQSMISLIQEILDNI